MRINLLMKARRYREALAWVLYEIETNSNNVAALALRKKLRRILLIDTPDTGGSSEDDESQFDWPGVAGMRTVKAILERDIILPLSEPELFQKYKLSLPNGIMFYGPPGCGKTHIARALAKKTGRRFIEVKPSDLGSIYIHASQRKISGLFADAREQAPSLLFFDEVDALLPERGGAGGHYDNEVNEFLVQLQDCAKQDVLVIAATNKLRKIDPAVLRPGRFDRKVFIGLPDIEARTDLLRMSLRDRPAMPIDHVGVARSAGGLTCAEFVQVCDEAARMALDQRQEITEIGLHRALKNFKAAGFVNDPVDWE